MPPESFSSKRETAGNNKAVAVEKTAEEAASFDRQYDKRTMIELVGTEAETVDVSPEEPKTETPVFLAPGWACDLKTYKPVIRELCGTGRRVVSMEHPRLSGEIGSDIEAAAHRAKVDEESVFKYPKAELRKALNIIQVLDKKGIKSADVVAHSEAAVNTVIAATLRPDLFNNMVFYGPSGLIGDDNLGRLSVGFAGQIKRPESLRNVPISKDEKHATEAAAKSLPKYFLTNPLRALNEILDLAETKIDAMLKKLHENGKGIFVISGVDDPVFPNSMMERIADRRLVDGFMTVPGGHGISETLMPDVDRILFRLEELKKKERTE